MVNSALPSCSVTQSVTVCARSGSAAAPHPTAPAEIETGPHARAVSGSQTPPAAADRHRKPETARTARIRPPPPAPTQQKSAAGASWRTPRAPAPRPRPCVRLACSRPTRARAARELPLRSQSPFSAVVVTATDCVRDIRNENLAVADLARARRRHQRTDDFVGPASRHYHLQLDLGQQVHLVLHAAIDFLVALLASVAAHLDHRHAVNADGLEGFLHFFEFVRLDDGFDLLHGSLRQASKLYPSSPCMLRSRPSISCCVSTRTPAAASHTLRITQVPASASPAAIAQPASWWSTCMGLPSAQPIGLPDQTSLTSLVANTPVRIAPSVPPAPCTPKASSESS